MNDLGAAKRASVSKRAAARSIDALVMAVIESVMVFATSLVSAIVTRPGLLSRTAVDHGLYSARAIAFFVFWTLLTIPASIPMVRYESVYTAWRGQTFSKRLLGIRVVCWKNQTASTSDHRLPLTRSLVRWAVPHIAGVTVAVTAAMVSFPMIARFRTIFFISAGAGLTAWTLVYLSSLWDKDGRGWHDKAAGTVVVEAASLSQRHDSQERQPRQPAPSASASPASEAPQQERTRN